MRRDWEDRARTDLLYSIDAQKRDWNIDDFYARGPVLVADFVDPILEHLGVDPSGRRVLEIGCGIGRLFAGLSQRFGDVWGIDISPAMVEQGRAQCPVKATWLVGDGQSLHGIPDASIDHVLSFEVFGHVPDPAIIHSYFLETWRVLRPEGTFQIQLRRRSDSIRQSIVRALPRPLRVATGALLQASRMSPVPAGDIDTWLGCLVSPEEATAFLQSLGFVDLAFFPSGPRSSARRGPRGYWIAGRKPPDTP